VMGMNEWMVEKSAVFAVCWHILGHGVAFTLLLALQ